MISELLGRPLWQLSGEEYVALHSYACSLNSEKGNAGTLQVVRIKGVHAVAEYCSCSASQIAKLLREGVLDAAILSRVGKSIVFDGDEARRRANEYQMQQRASRTKKANANKEKNGL